jgi:hypothetical protein
MPDNDLPDSSLCSASANDGFIRIAAVVRDEKILLKQRPPASALASLAMTTPRHCERSAAIHSSWIATACGLAMTRLLRPRDNEKRYFGILHPPLPVTPRPLPYTGAREPPSSTIRTSPRLSNTNGILYLTSDTLRLWLSDM